MITDRNIRFNAHVRSLYYQTDETLMRIINSKVYEATFRAAALRALVSHAPIDVTLGRP